MCLFPGMIENPSSRATPAAKSQQCRLYILVLLHFVLGIMLTVASPQLGFMEIIIPFILMCTAFSMNFCTLIFYIILMVNDCVQYLCIVGLIAQRGDIGTFYESGNPNYNPYLMTMLFIWLAFSPIALIISFLAYREFKGMAYDEMGIQNGSGGAYGGLGRAFNRGGNRNQSADDNEGQYQERLNPQQQQQQQNQGAARNANNQNSNYQQPQQPGGQQQQQRQNTTTQNGTRSGGFTPFSGQGVRIGG
eukprot:403339482